MGRGVYTNYQCRGKPHDAFTPTKHQQDTVKAFMKSKYKGLLLYHKLGSGKTCTAYLIADKMLSKGKIDKVYILSPGSLRAGWVNEYCKVCGKDSNYLQNNYIFITYNYMVGRDLPNFNNSLVIIDEVHNLINGAKNQSFHPTAIYNALAKSDCRILALSGTPVHNYVYEFALLGKLLKPGSFPEIRQSKDTLNEGAFMKYFLIEEDGTLKPTNVKTVKNMLSGIVSYYPGAGEEFVPTIEYMEPIKVVMTLEQEKNYWVKFIQEKKLAYPPDAKLKYTERAKYNLLQQLYIMAKKNILTRAASNFYYPKELIIKYGIPLDELLNDEVEEYTENNREPRAVWKDLPVSEGGWVKKKYFKDGHLYTLFSTKFAALLLNITMHNLQKHVLFTFFKKKSGVILIKSLLGMCGIHAEIFSGDLDDRQRKDLLYRFNSPENRYGEKIRILLVTEAGAEGISVLEARHMHILESSPRMNKTIQAIGRIARFKSHINLPKNEQNVKVWRYWSMASPLPITITSTTLNTDGQEETSITTIEDKTTVDESLYYKGMKTLREVDSFLKILQEVSITPY